MRNADEVIAAIHGSYQTGSKNGFHNVLALLDRMKVSSQPPVIHVAGTNGKGSVCAMLESVLRCAGLKTGLYTSPFLQAYQERIRLNGLPLDDALLVKYGNPLVEAAEALRQENAFVTPFEMGTALALAVSNGEGCDVAIVEVGMGGRKDPTNIVRPTACAITAIGLDHMAYLGDTLPQIAWEKAGIIKAGVPVVCHPATAEVAEVFARTAEALHAPLRQMSAESIQQADCGLYGSTACYQLEKNWPDVRLNLPGEYQVENAMTVLALVEELRKQGWHLPDEAVYAGLAHTVWPARLEWHENLLIDGAHNPQGVAALKRYVNTHLAGKRKILLTGVLRDKLQVASLRDLASLGDIAVTVTPDSPRAMAASEYADLLTSQGAQAEAAETLEAGLCRARELAGNDGIILATGSLYFAGELRTMLGLPWRMTGEK